MRVKIRREWREVDLLRMKREDIMELIVDLEEERDHIEDTLDQAKSEAAESGKYSDSHWFRRAQKAVKAIIRNIQRCEIELSRRKINLPEVFMDVCEEELEEKDFMEIKELAIQRVKELAVD